MLKLDIPERETIELQHAVIDINGTLAVDGVAIAGVAERLEELSEHLTIHLVTAGTHDHLQELERDLGFPIHVTHRSEEKLRYVRDLGPSKVIAIGNGANDTTMLRLAGLGIAVMATEGVSIRALQAADVVVGSPLDAIDLLLKPKRLIATLRG
jgi:soluble P-type ATPase